MDDLCRRCGDLTDLVPGHGFCDACCDGAGGAGFAAWLRTHRRGVVLREFVRGTQWSARRFLAVGATMWAVGLPAALIGDLGPLPSSLGVPLTIAGGLTYGIGTWVLLAGLLALYDVARGRRYVALLDADLQPGQLGVRHQGWRFAEESWAPFAHVDPLLHLPDGFRVDPTSENGARVAALLRLHQPELADRRIWG